ncbi:MAG: tetratricopeptide repeat protein [Candidatus Stahlbacteria bacterium]|nr:tetratricopeptide repeat protein [Candidatus Stahlbacteria bacterium]
MKKYLLIIFGLTGCVYYNTFYNAKEYYDKAIISTPPNKEFLNKSIEKCSKIVEYHKDSRYVPDALFLMGKCFIAKEEYEYAVRKFQELIVYYPDYKMADVCRLELGRSYIGKGDFNEAREVLAQVKDDKEEATKLIMDSYLREEDYENVIKIGKDYLSRSPKSKIKVDIFTTMGNAYDSSVVLDSALKYYEEAMKLATQKFQLSLSISDILIALNKYEEALQKLIPLRELVSAQEKIKLELLIAKCYKAKGDSKKAIEVLSAMETSADAQYELGLIYEDTLADLKNASKCYEQAQKLGGTSGIGNQAIIRASRLAKLAEYKAKLSLRNPACPDSIGDLAGKQDSIAVDSLLKRTRPDMSRPDTVTGSGEQVGSGNPDSAGAKICFLLAELYWIEFNQVDSALQEYEGLIQAFPQTEYAAKAAYSIKQRYYLKMKVIKNEKIAPDVVSLTIKDERIATLSKPGQFVNIRVSNSYFPLLRRPISVHSTENDTFKILFKIIGEGTKILSSYKEGDEIDVIGPLGNFYAYTEYDNILIIAGGIGVAPLYFLATRAKELGSTITTLIGAKTKNEVLCETEFAKVGKVLVTTEDGSYSIKGKVTGLLNPISLPEIIFACGPEGMLKAVKMYAHSHFIPCQVSLERHLACGMGVCLGCAVARSKGYKYVCKDGPVFWTDEVEI